MDNKASHCAKMISSTIRSLTSKREHSLYSLTWGPTSPMSGRSIRRLSGSWWKIMASPSSEVRFIQECKTERAKKAIERLGESGRSAGAVRLNGDAGYWSECTATSRCSASSRHTFWRPSLIWNNAMGVPSVRVMKWQNSTQITRWT